MAYDSNNVFARILRGELPCKKVHETAHSLAFHDIRPQAPTHVLVIPKGAYATWMDFAAQASAAEMADYVKAVADTAKLCGVEADGFRLLVNNGQDSHQEVPHLHVHILGGKALGPLLAR